MRRIVYFALPFFILGCSTKIYEPKHPVETKLKAKSHKELFNYTRKAETFRALRLKYVKKTSFIDDGVRAVYVYYDEAGHKLGKFEKINKDLAKRGDKLLLIKEKKVIKMPYLIYFAVKKGDIIALVFEDNSYGIYSLKNNKMIFINKDEPVIAGKNLGANILFYKDLILFPLLNGKIAVVDGKTYQFIRNIDISDNFIIDNIIYMKIVKDNLFMATPKKLVLFNPNFLIDYKTDIKHIIDDGKYIYLLSVDGKIIKFDSNLKKLKEIELPFADFFAPTICKGDIYTVTYGGYLLKINKDLNVTAYKTDQFDTSEPLRLKGCKIYNQDKVFFIE